MTPEEASFFKLLDDHVRTHHNCFLTEMFLNTAGTHYSLCFRPTGGSEHSPNRYACRYLKMEADEVRIVGGKERLVDSMIELLDRELSTLPQS